MDVVIAPDERLRVKTKPVKKIKPGLLQTFKEMIKLTKSFKDPEGVGLASTQIGEDEQYFVLRDEKKTADGKVKDQFLVVINPQILNYSKKTKVYLEGCLSIPNYWGEVERHLSLTVSYTDEDGQTVKKRLTGFPAWVFQHEYDHLQGTLYMDHVLSKKTRLFKVVGRDRAGAEVFEEVAI